MSDSLTTSIIDEVQPSIDELDKKTENQLFDLHNRVTDLEDAQSVSESSDDENPGSLALFTDELGITNVPSGEPLASVDSTSIPGYLGATNDVGILRVDTAAGLVKRDRDTYIEIGLDTAQISVTVDRNWLQRSATQGEDNGMYWSIDDIDTDGRKVYQANYFRDGTLLPNMQTISGDSRVRIYVRATDTSTKGGDTKVKTYYALDTTVAAWISDTTNGAGEIIGGNIQDYVEHDRTSPTPTVNGALGQNEGHDERYWIKGENFTKCYGESIGNDSSAIAISLDGQTLIDANGNVSVDWRQRQLIDGSGNVMVDWGNKLLEDGGGNEVVDWNDRTLDGADWNVLTGTIFKVADTTVATASLASGAERVAGGLTVGAGGYFEAGGADWAVKAENNADNTRVELANGSFGVDALDGGINSDEGYTYAGTDDGVTVASRVGGGIDIGSTHEIQYKDLQPNDYILVRR